MYRTNNGKKIKNILLSILIFLSIFLLLFFNSKEEKEFVKIEASYSMNFPKKIIYKEKKGFMEFKIELNLNENKIKKDPNSEKYYAEYSGTIKPEGFTFK